MSNTSDITLALLEAQLPGSTPNFRSAVLFEIVSEFCREVLQKNPPVDFKSAVSGWLTDPEWIEYHMTIISGTLARFHAMPNKPWTNAAAAQAHAELYKIGYERGRERYATIMPWTGALAQLMKNVLMLIPGMRSEAIQQELWNTVEELQRNIRQQKVPDLSADPSTWLTVEEYKTYYRLLLSGTLLRIYGQSAKPWNDPKAEVAQRAIFEQEVVVARSDAQAEDAVDPTDRLLSSIRAQLPGIKDTAIYPELFNVIDEACRQHFIWCETIRYRLVLGQQQFNITPDGCDVVRVGSVSHSKIDNQSQVDPITGTLAIMVPITRDMLDESVIVRMVLAPKITSRSEDASNWIPVDMWGRFHQLLLYGCLHKLMLQASKPWSNAKIGAVHGQVYRRLLIQATQEARTEGLIPARQNWIYPRYT